MGLSRQTKDDYAFVSRHKELLSIFSLSMTRNNLVDCTFVNRNETFIFFFLPGLPRIQKLLLGILLFMAI